MAKKNQNAKKEIPTTELIVGNIESKAIELSIDKLRWHAPDSLFNFKTTEELKPLDSIVGQPRAIESIRLGAELRSKGYNIFVSGLSGTGRLTTVKKILEEISVSCPQLYDYCYVNNFNDTDNPRLIKLPVSQGKEFSTAVNEALIFIKSRLPKVFDDETFQEARNQIIEGFQHKEKDVLHVFDEKIKPFNFVRGVLENDQGVSQPEVFPLINTEPVQIDNIEELVAKGTLTRENADSLHELYRKFHTEIFDLAKKSMKMLQEFRKSLSDYDKSAASVVITSVLDEIAIRFPDEKVKIFIEEVKKYALGNINLFVPQATEVVTDEEQDSEQKDADFLKTFSVNVILDNSATVCAPIITETSPTYTNLFGTIERTYDSSGYWKTDFTKVKAGSILKADNGFLIVNADDLFNEQGVWNALKRVLLYNKLEIQPYEAVFQLSQLHLKPEPIDVNVKVIIIGGLTLFKMLYYYEKGFKKIFKINAQFDHETERTDELVNYYSRFISKICGDENLPHCTPDGAAAILEWAVEQAGSQNRITLKFSDVADVVRESAFYDRGSKDKFINREDVEKAIKFRRYRNDLMDEKLRDYIIEGSVLINTSGEKVGQINGLTVLDDGLLSFGKPARITANISAGSSGIINVEREVEMSGPIHSKGVLIITGFIKERFAQRKPLNMTASITFEQSYGGIDGDSASAAEIYVLLSALSRIPIRQYFAITGSVSQKGDIQPIGGVNEKIRGFYEICKIRGFDGTHGIIIPKQNVKDLMLGSDIIDDVKAGNFHLYSFSKIEDAVELLMGVKAGEICEDGTYPPDTVFGEVEKRLEELRKANKDEDDDEEEDKKKKKKKAPKKDEEIEE